MLLITNELYAYSTPFAIPPIPAPTTPRKVAEIEGNESISSKNVKAQLKTLAEEAKSDESIKVYIISYSRPNHRQEAKLRAKLVTNQLVRKYQLKPNRIVIVDGGIYENQKIVIYFMPMGAFPPNDDLSLRISEILNYQTKYQKYVLLI